MPGRRRQEDACKRWRLACADGAASSAVRVIFPLYRRVHVVSVYRT